MKNKLPYIAPNQWYHDAFNRLCLFLLNTQRKLYTDSENISQEAPLFVTGFFRSGTSLTTQLLQALGMDLGPQKHLLLAKNQRAELNPDGFFENYLFMEMSLYAFTKLKSWGHIPPQKELVNDLHFDDSDRARFAEFTLCGVHDDRISNLNKIDALKKYDLLSLNTYLQKEFKYPFAIKNPHFAVLSPYLIKKWPKSKFLVCFREPTEAIQSAAKITPLLNESVYQRYYSDLLKLDSERVLFLSHSGLIANPEYSLKKLCEVLPLDASKIPGAIKLIKPELHRYKTESNSSNSELTLLYQELKNKSINK